MDFRGKTILITGITGTIGTWFAKYLIEKGARVIGIAREKGHQSILFRKEELEPRMIFCQGSVTDRTFLQEVAGKYEPELIFHFGGQAIIQRAEEDNRETYESNVIGTLNILETMKCMDSVRTGLFVTSGRCYEPDCPNDSVYCKSRECADMLIETYYNVFLKEQSKGIILFKLDNVIAGGDWGENRLIPECIRAWLSGDAMHLKNPNTCLYWNDIYGFLAAVEWLFCKEGHLTDFGKYSLERKEANHFFVSQIAEWVDEYVRMEKDVVEDFCKAISAYQIEKSNRDAFGFQELAWNGHATIEEAIRHAVYWYKKNLNIN